MATWFQKVTQEAAQLTHSEQQQLLDMLMAQLAYRECADCKRKSVGTHHVILQGRTLCPRCARVP